MEQIINVVVDEIGLLNAQAKAAINNFLADLNISKIIYIDDRCSINELRESFKGILKSLQLSNRGDLSFINWDLPPAIFDKDISETWDIADEEMKRNLFFEVLKCEKNQEDIVNSAAPLKLKEILEDKIDLLSPTEWILQKDMIVSKLSESFKVLFLFDVEFKYAPLTDGSDGTKLASDLLNIPDISDFLYCGIFSHLFSVEEEYDKRNFYCSSLNLDKKRFYTISKKRFQDNLYLPGLAEGIKNTLLINEIEVLKNEASTIIRKSFNDSLEEIENLNPDSFNHIIQKSSEIEGVWEMETLIRLTNIITSDNALKLLLSDTQRTTINKSLYNIRKLEKNETGSKTKYNKKQIQNIRKRELYLDEKIINQLHFPISNGDIFSIKNKNYILIGQPCNLSLRSIGKRGNEYNTGFLLELKEIAKDVYDRYNKDQLTTLIKVVDVNLDYDNITIAKFSTFKTVDLAPLDLTVFNHDGIAKIDLNILENNLFDIQDSWKARYKYLHEIFLKYYKGIAIYMEIESPKKEGLKKQIYSGELFKGYNVTSNFNLNPNNTLEFDIKRISHYKTPYSTDLLQQFMQYLSRNAFEHDFLKN